LFKKLNGDNLQLQNRQSMVFKIEQLLLMVKKIW
jgi:2-keto-4-pentenoate hydratase/2-oxohepta-3-ene-1,7-dioic acid hydratase in catechol pathway